MIGVMSGTSLDGLDLALVEFNLIKGKWTYRYVSTTTTPYPDSWQKQLENARFLEAEALAILNINFNPKIIASEEYDLFIQIAAKFNISVIEEPLCMYRVSSNSLTNSSIKSRAQDKRLTFTKLEKNFLPEISRYNKAYQKAKAKINYYEFQNFYYQGNYNDAKRSLKKILFIDYRYFLIFVILYISPKFYNKILKWYDKRGFA